MHICEKSLCTGCMACANACAFEAVKLVENEKGFTYPAVDEDLCVNCGLCKKTCPVNNDIKGYEHLAVYAALVKDDNERLKSTSGGIFSALAKDTILHGGYVYGAAICDDLVTRHIEAHTLDEMDKLRNSKYVQSDMGRCFRNTKERLDKGKRVLFSGTPCQIAGLRNFLKKDYSNLLTVDLLCHGVPSPGMLRRYINSEERIAGAKMKSIQFRSKTIGWKNNVFLREFENGKTADWGDTFIPGFLENYYLRESCYTCTYCNDKRVGDITLGDYWGYKESAPEYIEDDDKGISLVIVNTEKGKHAFRRIRKEIAVAKRSMDDAKRGNPILYKPCGKPSAYSEFWADAEKMDWDGLKEKYLTELDSSDWMSKERREYFSQPFVKRHNKRRVRRIKRKIKQKLKRLGGKQ